MAGSMAGSMAHQTPVRKMASNDNTIKHVNGRLADADVKAKVADALRQEADMATIAEQMRAAKEQNDQKRLQLLVARIEKAIGKNVEQRVLVGALVILVVKTFQFAPKHKHSQMFVNFMNVVSSMLSVTKMPTDAPGQDNGQQGEKSGG